MATVELYRRGQFPDVGVLDHVLNHIAQRCEEESASLEKTRDRCEALGLQGQVRLLTQKKEEVEPEVRAQSALYPGNYYPVLSPREKGVWNTWLPSGEDLVTYSGRELPSDVLAELTLLHALKLFQKYHIRTYSDKQTYECVLVGYFNDEAFLVARWGERLRPVGTIFKTVRTAGIMNKISSMVNSSSLPLTMFVVFGVVSVFLWFAWLVMPSHAYISNPFGLGVRIYDVRNYATLISVIGATLFFYFPMFNSKKFLDRYR